MPQLKRYGILLLQDSTFRVWTSAFHPGSYFEGRWEPGDTINFKTPEGDGVISKILEHTKNKSVTMEHQGIIFSNKPDFESEEAKSWKGTHESYYVKSTADNQKTELKIDVDVVNNYFEHFTISWKKALEKVKELSEKN